MQIATPFCICLLPWQGVTGYYQRLFYLVKNTIILKGFCLRKILLVLLRMIINIQIN